MDRKQRAYRTDRGGISRAVAILLVLIAVMLVIIAIPSWNAYRYRAQRLACEQAMKSARDGLIIEYLSRWDSGSVQEAMKTLDEVMPERANICPSGGTVYLVPRGEDGIFEPVCGLHDSDGKLRCRLNASRAMDLLGEERRIVKRETKAEPESVRIQLNGKALECVRVQEAPDLRRGTGTTSGFDGVVVFYGLAGEGQFTTDGAAAGAIAYFIYADEDYCAIWRADDGWTGTAYDGY